jgi:uncharacterized membrane protein
MKKSQSMTLNTVIIAALVILVLIVLSFIFIRYMGAGDKNIASCEAQQGKCVASKLDCGDIGNEQYPVYRMDLKCSNNLYCCGKLAP